MKYLDVERLNAITSFFDGCDFGDRKLEGKVEAYSCKPAGDDKKLSKELEKQYIQELAQSPPGSLGASPLGDFSEHQTRKLLINLIITMNASFPDYDFRTCMPRSDLTPDQFVRENLGIVINNVNTHLAELTEMNSTATGFLEELWKAMDDTIILKECQVYSYISDMENDPFSGPGKLWSFNYFFYNKAEKKIIFFACNCERNYGGEDDVQGDDDDDDEMMMDQMEMISDHSDEVDDLGDSYD